MRIKYIRVAPTTLYRAPECYGNYNVRCIRTNTCPVEYQCISLQPPEFIGVNDSLYPELDEKPRLDMFRKNLD